jgi:predicted PurR-regulated permease PerM
LNLKLNIWQIIGLIVILALAIIFFKIVIYISISLILFLLGFPLTYRIENLRFGKFRIPSALAALLTVLILVAMVSGLFFVIIPPLVAELKFLSDLNFYEVMHNLLAQFPGIKNALLRLGSEQELEHNLVSHLNQLVNTSNITLVADNLFSYSGSIIGGTLCVLFITFFFLKDEQLAKQSLLLLTPSGKEETLNEIFSTSKRMLSKYFAGIFLDMFIVGISAMIILSILGIKNALLISFVAGLLNIIPYIGSFITMSIAIFLGVSSCINSGNYELIGPTINKIFFALISINLIDAFVIQPLIFSKSVQAHPLEIFIVTLMAATIGGIPGMIVALPAYTLFRIIAKEFLTHLKFFKKLTEKISEIK